MFNSDFKYNLYPVIIINKLLDIMYLILISKVITRTLIDANKYVIQYLCIDNNACYEIYRYMNHRQTITWIYALVYTEKAYLLLYLYGGLCIFIRSVLYFWLDKC